MAWNVPDPERARELGAAEPLEARAHLAGGLVGERHGEDAPRRHARARDEVRDPVRDDARLAAARAREDEQRPLGVRHGRRLRLVELGLDRIASRARACAIAHDDSGR